MKLKTGIIGCGKVADFHAKAYEKLENSAQRWTDNRWTQRFRDAAECPGYADH